MRIPRTSRAYRPRCDVWAFDRDGDAYPFADLAIVADVPSHSPVLGPDGQPLEYEPPEPAGFRLTAE